MTADPLFHMIVEDVFSIRGRGTVVTGKIDTGSLKVGDEIMIRGAKGDKKAVVTGIEAFRKTLEQAKSGDTVGILLRDITKEDVAKGDELHSPGMDFTWKP
jgi:elongation factor Tu